MPPCAQEYRCTHCHKLFFKGLLIEGSVEVKCRYCHSLNLIHANETNELICLIKNCPNRIHWKNK